MDARGLDVGVDHADAHTFASQHWAATLAERFDLPVPPPNECTETTRTGRRGTPLSVATGYRAQSLCRPFEIAYRTSSTRLCIWAHRACSARAARCGASRRAGRSSGAPTVPGPRLGWRTGTWSPGGRSPASPGARIWSASSSSPTIVTSSTGRSGRSSAPSAASSASSSHGGAARTGGLLKLAGADLGGPHDAVLHRRGVLVDVLLPRKEHQART